MSLNRIFALLLLSWITAHAQEPAETPPAPVEAPAQPPQQPANAIPGLVPPPPGVPIPGANQAPAGAPAGLPPGLRQPPGIVVARIDPAKLALTKIEEDIVEPKLSGTALAGLYRKYTGRRVIVSAAAATAEFSFVQDASPQDPLTYAEAAELLRKAAIIEQFVFVPHPQDPNLDILSLSTGGIRPPAIGLEIFNENSALPETDSVITYVMNLDYIKPAEAVNTFTQIIGQFGAFGSIAAVPNASAVVITENASLIRKLVELKKEIDKPGSVQATRFIKVQYADVTEIATLLTELLTAQQSTQQTAGIQRADAPAAPSIPGAAPAAGGGGDGGGGGEATPVQIVPEPRTNRIFAMGRPVDLIFVEGLVREFDIPTGEKNFLRRKLKFLTVSEFLPIAGDAITRAFSGTGEGGGTSGGTSGGSRTSGSSNRSNTSASSNRNTSSGFGNSNSGSSGFGSSSGSSGFGGFSGSSSGGRSGSGASLGDPAINSAPESLLVGRTLLVADNITNSIVAQGPPPALEILERLLDQIDVKSDQVMISTIFGQLSLGDTLSTGVDWLKLFNEHGDGSGIAGSILTGTRNIFDPADLTEFSGSRSTTNDDGTTTESAGFPGSSGLSLYGRIGNDVAAYVNMLQTDSNFTVLSRPSVYTSNNRRGSISSGRRIPVPTNSNSFSAGGVSTNIEYRDVVLKLEVIPLVNSPEEITLEIALVSDDVVGQSDEIEGLGRVPIIGTREILTTVTVPNNQTVVLGGLISENDRKTVTGIPILSSIPGLGRLFSTNIDTKERDELLVFIQPSIVSNDPQLNNLQTDTDGRFNVSDKARDFADGPGVLPAPGTIPQADGKTTNAPSASPIALPSSSTTLKPSIRPIHRR